MADANPWITQSSKKKKKEARKVSTTPGPSSNPSETSPSETSPFLSLQLYSSVTLRKPRSIPSTEERKPAAKTKPDLTINTSAYTAPVASPEPSPVLPFNEYTFNNMEVDSPTSAPRDQVQQFLDAEDLVPVLEPNSH